MVASSDDYTVAMLAAYYSGLRLTAESGVLIPPGFAPTNPNFQELYPEPKYVHDVFESNPLVKYRGRVAALNYGFKRIFYNNTHHYFADFYVAWYHSGPIGILYNNLREAGQNIYDRHAYAETAADVLVNDVAVNHVSQVKGWLSNDLMQLPQLLEEDACADTIDEIYAG